MLIILPSSETKRPPPETGSPLDLSRLSFPSLTQMRKRVMDALIQTSQEPDALRRLMVGPTLAGEVSRNLHLRDLPTRTATETYSGPLYQGLDAGSWTSEETKRAGRHLVVVSALWGLLGPADQIPPYRLHVCSRLIGLDRLEPAWREYLDHTLSDAAGGRGPIVDLRSPAYQAVGRPTGLEDVTATLRVRSASAGRAHIGDVIAKRVRGEAARHLLASATVPGDPLDVADLLATRWPIEIEPPSRRKRTWEVVLLVPR